MQKLHPPQTHRAQEDVDQVKERLAENGNQTMEFPNEDSNQDRSFYNEDSIQNISSTLAKKRRELEVMEVRAQMKTAVNVLKNLADRPRTEVDEVDLYCQLLAKKFNEQQREDVITI